MVLYFPPPHTHENNQKTNHFTPNTPTTQPNYAASGRLNLSVACTGQPQKLAALHYVPGRKSKKNCLFGFLVYTP